MILGMGAWAQGIAVQLDGRTLYFDQPPAMIGGRLLVPLRGIFEALNADVVYTASTRSIQATKGSTVVQLQLGSRTALIDGRTVYLDVPADTVGGRTMVPLRFVSESLGAEVKWSGATKTVMIASGGPATTDPGNNSGNNNGNNNSQAGAPKIDRVVHNGTDVLAPGDALEVIVYGDPGATASFEIMGKTTEQPLPEVSSGRYQTRYIIPNGLVVERGVLLAHLKNNGRDAAQESDRQITVRAGSATSNVNWTTFPAANATANTARPQVSVNFPENVQSNTVRFYVDGIDFSRQTQMNGNQLLWTPQYDLSDGNHKAQVRATANSGRTLDYDWSFVLSAANVNTGNFNIQELRPPNGQTVTTARPGIGAIFNQTVSSVTLTVDNVNVTNQNGVQRYSNGIVWTPSYNLSNGVHNATATGLDQSNRQVSQSWTFTVGQNSTQTPSSQNLMVSNISNGTTVPPVFNVQGSAEPGRQVNVLVEYSPSNILEVITGQTRQISKSVLVGSNGRFDVPIDVSVVGSGQTFRVTVSDGGTSPSAVYTIRRQ